MLWEQQLPGTVAEGQSGHVDDHNKIKNAILEARTNVDTFETSTGIALGGKANATHTHAQADVTGLQSALDAKAPSASPAFTGTPTGITKVHVGLGNADNTSDASKPVSTAAQTALDAKAPLASPALTGTPTAPTPATATNSTRLATTAFVQAVVAALVDSSPAALDTLNELSAALANDPNFAATMTTQLAAKAPLASPTLTGDPKAPTPTTTDNDTSIATTAFVRAAITMFAGATSGNMVYYNATTNTWPSRPSSSDPVMAISTKSPAAIRPPWMTTGQNDGDMWIQDPESEVA